MTTLESLYNRFDDLLNPIIVKELRQVVRGKFFWGVLILFLGFQCVVLSLSIADRGLTSRSIGAETLTFLFGILFFTSFVIVPVYNAVKFAKERNDGSDELLFITTITPQTIVKGKFAAAMVFIFLLYSAFSPFMAMTFFLSGVDLPMTFMALLIGLLFSAAGAMGQICFAALARDSHSQQFFRGFGIFVQISAFFSIAGAGSDMVHYGTGRLFAAQDTTSTILSLILCAVGVIYFFYRASAAIIAPAGANRMYQVRLSAFVIWIGSLLLAVWWAMATMSARFIIVWGGLVCAGLCLAIAVAVSERDCLSERIAREIPRNPLKRRLAFLFYSGSAGGLAWIACLGILTIVTMHLFSAVSGIKHSSDLGEFSIAIFSFLCYGLGYGLIASIIRRKFFSSLMDVRNTWVVLLLVSVAFAVLPMFFWVFTGSDSEMFMLGNPFASLSRDRYLDGFLFGLMVMMTGLIINLPWLRRQVKEFSAAEAGHE